jgi:hypothetical protein
LKEEKIHFFLFQTLIVGINLAEAESLSLQIMALQYENIYTGTLPSSWNTLTNLNLIKIVTFFLFVFKFKH